MSSFDDAARDLPAFELSDEVKQRQLDAILSGRGSSSDLPQPPHRRWRRSFAIGAGVVVMAGASVGVAAAFGVFSRPPSERGLGYCYSQADLSSPRLTFGVAVPPDEDDGIGDAARMALDICQLNWRTGVFLTTTPDIQYSVDPNGPPVQDVPPLAVCVLETGAIGIFPGDAITCERLGIPNAEL
jgi:hypothetical protein